MDSPDRRRSQRQSAVAVASLETRNGLCRNDQALCSVRDMSRHGIGLETGQPPIRGQEVILRLAIGDEIHELVTRATRVQQKGSSQFYVVGLDWSRCSQDDLAFLDRVLEVGIG